MSFFILFFYKVNVNDAMLLFPNPWVSGVNVRSNMRERERE